MYFLMHSLICSSSTRQDRYNISEDEENYFESLDDCPSSHRVAAFYRNRQNDLERKVPLRNAGFLLMNAHNLENIAREEHSNRNWSGKSDLMRSDVLTVEGGKLPPRSTKTSPSKMKQERLFIVSNLPERPKSPIKKLPGVIYSRTSRNTIMRFEERINKSCSNDSLCSTSSKSSHDNTNNQQDDKSSPSYKFIREDMQDFSALFVDDDFNF